MSRLDELRKRLTRLLRQRRNARLGTAWAAVAIAACCALLTLFTVDWALEMTRLQRLIAMFAAVGTISWTYRRFAAPLLREGESLLDVALLVERQQHIDSDLVAALQFETTEAGQWGSTQLEAAVVDYVADFSSGLDVFEGFDRERMKRRGIIAAVALFTVLTLAIAFPRHTVIFLNRMMMSAAHYPTRTNISKVWINGQPVTLIPGQEQTVQCAYGLPLSIALEATGEIPASAKASLWTEGGLNTEIALARQTHSPLSAKAVKLTEDQTTRHKTRHETEANKTNEEGSSVKVVSDAAKTDTETKSDDKEGAATPATRISTQTDEVPDGEESTAFAGKLPRLVDSLRYQLYVGDAWTEPAFVKVIPLPKVEFTLTPTPPKYAQRAEPTGTVSSTRQLAVVEGSRIDLEVTADKPLVEATLIIEDQRFALERVPKSAEQELDRWRLKTAGTPLASVTGPLAYQIEAEDEDGLKPSQPIQGFIRLRADRRPRVFGTIGTRNIRPLAKQPITYHASDDFGVNAVRLQVQVLREHATERNDSSAHRVLDIRPAGKPELKVDGTYTLDLSTFDLAKGDQVTVTLEAEDYRGDSAGQSSQSEPLTMYVTDEGGVLADLTELDEQAARQFETIIKLGIGAKP